MITRLEDADPSPATFGRHGIQHLEQAAQRFKARHLDGMRDEEEVDRRFSFWADHRLVQEGQFLVVRLDAVESENQLKPIRNFSEGILVHQNDKMNQAAQVFARVLIGQGPPPVHQMRSGFGDHPAVA